MAKLTKNDKAVLRSYIESLRIDITMISKSSSGPSIARDQQVANAMERLTNLDKHFEISE